MPILFTIGHSTRSITEFIDLLKAFKIKQLIDVRTIPKSRHNPQFNEEALSSSLNNMKIKYFHDKRLGGLRHPKKDSINTGWRNKSFRGYADYMQTDEFYDAIEDLKIKATKRSTVIMCAEAVPWRCHRSMIGDALVKDKWQVLHIMSKTSANDHRVTPFARMKKGRVFYPKSQPLKQ
jgi:uncharacterized protein (DUF488 family)